MSAVHTPLTRSLDAPSWYEDSAGAWTRQSPLRGEQRADVVILGAGLTGLSAALELRARGLDVVLLEAHQAGWGASGRSGGQVIFGYGCEQSRLRRLLGAADARRLFDWSIEGVQLIGERCAAHGIDCDFHAGHAHAAILPRQVDELKHWQADLEEHCGYSGTELHIGAAAREWVASARYRALLVDPRSGHLHPLAYTRGLARAALAAGVRLHEGSAVTAVEPGTEVLLRTAQGGQVRAPFAVLAGNAWLGRLLPALERRIMPVGTYIAATQPLEPQRAQALIARRMAVADINFVLDYFRLSADHRLLFGGRVSYSGVDPPALGAKLRRRMLQVFPDLHDTGFSHIWGGLVDITMNRAPDFGRIGPNLYYAQGFSGHGIAATGLAGRVLAEAIAGQAGRLDVFGRIAHRTFPGGRWLRTPMLMLAMLAFRLRDAW